MWLPRLTRKELLAISTFLIVVALSLSLFAHSAGVPTAVTAAKTDVQLSQQAAAKTSDTTTENSATDASNPANVTTTSTMNVEVNASSTSTTGTNQTTTTTTNTAPAPANDPDPVVPGTLTLPPGNGICYECPMVADGQSKIKACGGECQPVPTPSPIPVCRPCGGSIGAIQTERLLCAMYCVD